MLIQFTKSHDDGSRPLQPNVLSKKLLYAAGPGAETTAVQDEHSFDALANLSNPSLTRPKATHVLLQAQRYADNFRNCAAEVDHGSRQTFSGLPRLLIMQQRDQPVTQVISPV